MKNKHYLRISQAAVVLLVVAALLCGVAVAPHAQATVYQASSIEKLEGISEKWVLKTVWGVGYKFEVKE